MSSDSADLHQHTEDQHFSAHKVQSALYFQWLIYLMPRAALQNPLFAVKKIYTVYIYQIHVKGESHLASDWQVLCSKRKVLIPCVHMNFLIQADTTLETLDPSINCSPSVIATITVIQRLLVKLQV